MILISGYDNDYYNSTLTPENGWTKRMIDTHTRDTRGKDLARTEVLWMNQEYVDAKSEYRVPIVLSEKERRERKINPPRKNPK